MYALRGEARTGVPRHGEGSFVVGGRAVILVPRQLARSGMTGDVPYYGGRFTPAQAYAASHTRRAAAAAAPAPAPSAPPRPAAPPSPDSRAAQLEALHQLRDEGVISAAEHASLASRVSG
jgi:hypothetical protein